MTRVLWPCLPTRTQAKWSQALKVLGSDATLTAEYDRNANQNFPNEATLTGSSGNIGYELKSGFGQTVDYSLSTKTDDGSKVEVEGSADLLSAADFSVNKVTATSSRSLRGNDYDLEISHNLADNESKLRLSTVLGGLSGGGGAFLVSRMYVYLVVVGLCVHKGEL